MLTLTTRIFVLSFATFAVLQFLLLKLFLYWRYEWVDILMHFFGGALIAIGIYAARDLSVPLFHRFTSLIPTLLVVLVIAVAWEVLEYVSGMSVYLDNFWRDTVGDLILGLLGGVVGNYVAIKLEELDRLE